MFTVHILTSMITPSDKIPSEIFIAMGYAFFLCKGYSVPNFMYIQTSDP